MEESHSSRTARFVCDGEVGTEGDEEAEEVVCARWKGPCYSGHSDLMVSAVGAGGGFFQQPSNVTELSLDCCPGSSVYNGMERRNER